MRVAPNRPTGLLLAWLLLCGCSSLLAPIPDRWRFFTLTALPEATLAPAGGGSAAHGTVYGLGPIKLPAYLERGEIASRISPTEVTYSHTDRWAEPLSVQVASVLSQNLSGLLGTSSIFAYPWQPDARVTRQIEINLRQFECEASRDCRLDGRWWIEEPRGGRVLLAKETSLSRPGSAGGDTVANSLSQLLGELSQEIAAALQSLPAQTPPR